MFYFFNYIGEEDIYIVKKVYIRYVFDLLAGPALFLQHKESTVTNSGHLKWFFSEAEIFFKNLYGIKTHKITNNSAVSSTICWRNQLERVDM